MYSNVYFQVLRKYYSLAAATREKDRDRILTSSARCAAQSQIRLGARKIRANDQRAVQRDRESWTVVRVSEARFLEKQITGSFLRYNSTHCSCFISYLCLEKENIKKDKKEVKMGLPFSLIMFHPRPRPRHLRRGRCSNCRRYRYLLRGRCSNCRRHRYRHQHSRCHRRHHWQRREWNNTQFGTI